MNSRQFVALIVGVALSAPLVTSDLRAASFQGLGFGTARSVSDDGSTIVGSGDVGSGNEAVRWTVGGGHIVGLMRISRPASESHGFLLIPIEP